MRTYKYIGQIQVNLPNYGIVYPDQTITTNIIINHPYFVKQEDEVKKHKKSFKYQKI
jgi:hypothetical protein